MEKSIMENETKEFEELLSLKDKCHHLEERIKEGCALQEELAKCLSNGNPNIPTCLEISLKVISVLNGDEDRNRIRRGSKRNRGDFASEYSENVVDDGVAVEVRNIQNKRSRSRNHLVDGCHKPDMAWKVHETDLNEGDALSIVKAMVSAILLEQKPFVALDSAGILRRIEKKNCTPVQRAALSALKEDNGDIDGVENALKAIEQENKAIEIEPFTVSGRKRLMVLEADQTLLAQGMKLHGNSSNSKDIEGFNIHPPSLGSSIMGFSGFPPLASSDIQQSVGMIRGYRQPNMWSQAPIPYGDPRFIQWPPMPSHSGFVPPMQTTPKTEEDDMKEVEALLKKKSYKEMQQSIADEEIYSLIHRPTAKESAFAEQFKSKGEKQLTEYCVHGTKEACRKKRCSFLACEKLHFRRIMSPHTDVNLGDCTFLNNCRRMRTCKYVHYELDPVPDTGAMMGMANVAQQQRPVTAENVQLAEKQWINCDIRTFKMDILGQFAVIMADPPWDIHMDLPYNLIPDDEVKNLNIPVLQSEGLIFLWVTGRAMEVGRECLEQWGYRRAEELVWIKVNQIQRLITTGKTGHWLNHSKEHCLIGIKGNPQMNCKIDTDVIVSQIREVSRKPDEVYSMIERISPGTRKIELFARKHNIQPGWLSLGNQLDGVRLVDEDLRTKFKSEYPDVELKP